MPRSYVGYSAFILMGLLKRCQPCVWEGAAFIDLLEVFAPWAKECCTTADNFLLIFPQDATTVRKGGLIGAAMLIDLAWFEGHD